MCHMTNCLNTVVNVPEMIFPVTNDIPTATNDILTVTNDLFLWLHNISIRGNNFDSKSTLENDSLKGLVI